MTDRSFHATEIGDRFGGVVHRHDLEGPRYDARLTSPIPAREAPLALADRIPLPRSGLVLGRESEAHAYAGKDFPKDDNRRPAGADS